MRPRTLYILIILLLLAIATRPERESFERAVRQHAGKHSIFHELAFGAVVKFAGALRRIKVADYGVCTIVAIEPMLKQPRRQFLGVFGTFIPLSLDIWQEAFRQLRPNCPGCVNGICIGQKTCLCFPSWVGDHCQRPVPDFVSVWTSTKRFLPRALIYDGSAILGVPTTYLPPEIVRFGKNAGLLNLSTRLGILDIILFANILVYLLWYIAPRSFMLRHFTASWNNTITRGNLHTLITASFSHLSILHLGFNMYFFYHWGQAMYFELGPSGFFTFYLNACISTTMASLLYTQHRNKVIAGASGCMMAMRLYLAMRFWKVGGGNVDWVEVRQMIGWQLLVDFAMGSFELDWGAYVGAVTTAIAYHWEWLADRLVIGQQQYFRF